MPRGVYTDFKCKRARHPKFTPQAHQEFIVKYFWSSPYKGLLLYHRLGSGKTCSSILTSDAMLTAASNKKVYVMSPGSLRQGWIDEYCQVCGRRASWLTKYYTFITYNYNVKKSLPADFDDSIVIIDEVHNLVNSVKNNAKNAAAIYKKLMASDCRILVLSGTPIFNQVYEWPYLGNLLKPNTFSTDRATFMAQFKQSNDGTLEPIDKAAFMKSLQGIISYFPGLGGQYYPEVIIEDPIKVIMTPDQEAKFWPKLMTEDTLIKFGMPPESLKRKNPARYQFLKQLFIMSKKRILSRQPSNFYYPSDIYTVITGGRVKKKADKLAPEGWVSPEYFSKGQLESQYSSKMTALFRNILEHFNSKHMVFTFFKENSGVNIMKAMLDMCGLKTAVFSGDLTDTQRKKLLARFNSPKNRYGDDIKVIFVTDAGAEGITLKETGHVHILESDPRENKIEQAIGRAVRYKSHTAMPKELQKVHIWRYWSVSAHEKGSQLTVEYDAYRPDGTSYKESRAITVSDTIDELLYSEGQHKMNELRSFMELLQEASIESEATSE